MPHLRDVRLKRGLRQVDLVALMRKLDPDTALAQNTISKLETLRRHKAPSLTVIKALARALRVAPLTLEFGPHADYQPRAHRIAVRDDGRRMINNRLGRIHR